jgi:hypothetical protein
MGRNDAGMVPAKEQDKPQAPLSEEEAWYHFQRTQSGNVDSARFLLLFGMVPSLKSGGSALHTAAASGNVEAVKAQLSSSTAITLVNEEKKDGMTPLITASMMGHGAVVDVLLDEGADVEAVGSNGASALMIAASMGHTDVMKKLLDAGANANAEHGFAKVRQPSSLTQTVRSRLDSHRVSRLRDSLSLSLSVRLETRCTARPWPSIRTDSLVLFCAGFMHNTRASPPLFAADSRWPVAFAVAEHGTALRGRDGARRGDRPSLPARREPGGRED